MTCREKLKIEHPECVSADYIGGCLRCPYDYGYLERPDYCLSLDTRDCSKCLDREIPGTETFEKESETIAELRKEISELRNELRNRIAKLEESIDRGW